MIKVVKLGAPWCPPCRQMSPTIEKLKEAYKDNENVIIEDINIDEDKELSELHNVRSIPTTLFFHNDELVDKRSGILIHSQIEQVINNYIS